MHNFEEMLRLSETRDKGLYIVAILTLEIQRPDRSYSDKDKFAIIQKVENGYCRRKIALDYAYQATRGWAVPCSKVTLDIIHEGSIYECRDVYHRIQ